MTFSLKKLNPFKRVKPPKPKLNSSNPPPSAENQQANSPAESVQRRSIPASTPPSSTSNCLAVTTHTLQRSSEGSEQPEEADASILALASNSSWSTNLTLRGQSPQHPTEPVVPQPGNSSAERFEGNDSYGIKLHYNPPSAVVDIVFVHGLTGNAYTTWFHTRSGVHWPRDLVKRDLVDSRVMTFGYDADVVNFWTHAAQDGVSGFANDLLGSLAGYRTGMEANRKIIFVVHSLGGLVTQRALSTSRESRFPHLRMIETCTIGICFLGTPHHGTDLAKWGAVLTDIVNIVKPANRSIVKLLRRGSEALSNVQDSFHNVLEKRKQEGSKIEIVCFYEQLAVGKSFIVPKESAIITGELHYPIYANHMDMTKFSNSQQKAYKDIIREIRRLQGSHLAMDISRSEMQASHIEQDSDLPQTIKTRFVHDVKAPHKPFSYLPLSRNAKFVGRLEQLNTLKEKLFIDSYCQKVAIVGLGGVGKTQIALEFAYQVRETHPNYSVLWVPAISQESFEHAFLEIAQLLRIRELADEKADVKQAVKRYLGQEEAGQWLFILDNADSHDILFGSNANEAAALTDYIPQSSKGSIVYTTRSLEAAISLASNEVVEVVEMEEEAATKFLSISLIREDLSSNTMAVSELLNELTFLPLAITQAAAYINRNKISISTYLELLRDTEDSMVAVLSRDFQDNYRYKESKNPVAATWLISFAQIRSQDPLAADLLSFMSCIEPKAIPRSILPDQGLEESAIHAIGTLSGYSFITEREDGKSYDLHRLVHLATRNWVREEGLTAIWTKKVTQHFTSLLRHTEFINPPIWKGILPHVQKILDSNAAAKLEERYQLCRNAGWCLYVDGRPSDAVKRLSEVCEWNKMMLSEGNPARLASEHRLAIAYQANGQVKEAVELLQHVVKIEETLLAEDHPDRLASQHELAGAYQANGQVKEAVELIEHVVKIQEALLSEDHPDRLASQHELAGAYQANGQVKEAVELLEHVVKIEEALLSEDHPSRLVSQHELAGAYQANGQVKEAVELIEHVVRIREALLAEDHPSRLASQHGLARAYQANGQVKEAVELLEHVVKIQEALLSEDHPYRLASQHQLAIAYQANGQVKEAIEILECVVEIQKVLAEDHPSRLASRRSLAIAYEANGQAKEAIEILERVVEIQKVLAKDHPSLLASQHALRRLIQWLISCSPLSMLFLLYLICLIHGIYGAVEEDLRKLEV